MAELADCLSDIASLSASDHAALRALEGEVLSFRRGAEIRPQGDPDNAMFLLKDGCVKSSLTLDTGEQQILRLHFPGDLLGTAGIGYTEAVDALHAAGDVKLTTIDRTRFAELFQTHPRVAMLLYMSAQNERVVLMDRLCSVGQTSARSRVAALLITTCDRLRLGSDTEGLIKIPFPFTQPEMGQMAGLSAVHVNRVVKNLVQDGLVTWRRDSVTVRNLDGLRELAAIPRHSRDEGLSWMPWPPPPQESEAAAA